MHHARVAHSHNSRYLLLLALALTYACNTNAQYAQYGFYPGGYGGYGAGYGGGYGGLGYGSGYGIGGGNTYGGYPGYGGYQQYPSYYGSGYGNTYPCYGSYYCLGGYPSFGGYPTNGNGISESILGGFTNLANLCHGIHKSRNYIVFWTCLFI